MRPITLIAMACAALQLPAAAVVVISGAANDSAPPGQPHFANVGFVNGGSAVYLGNRWVLSAAHVAGSLPASATFGGNVYSTQAGTFHRLYDPATLDDVSPVFTDIVLFRLASDPGLDSVQLSTTTPTVGTNVTMIGGGRQQEPDPSFWQVTEVPGQNNDIWQELSPPYDGANATGFETTSTRVVKWGENQVEETGLTINYGAGPVTLFTTSFDSGAATHEAQGVSGDSGGAVLAFTGGGWRLAGMMAAVATLENQPGGANTAVIGNLTAAADLSAYHSQIFAVTGIPEVGTPILAVITLAFAVIRRQR